MARLQEIDKPVATRTEMSIENSLLSCLSNLAELPHLGHSSSHDVHLVMSGLFFSLLPHQLEFNPWKRVSWLIW